MVRCAMYRERTDVDACNEKSLVCVKWQADGVAFGVNV